MDKLVDLSLMDWTGAGAEGFKDATKKLPQELESAQKYFEVSGKALDSYAYKLRSVHTRLRPIIDDADEARATSKNYWNRVTDYNAALDRKDDPLPERPPDDDPALTALKGCYDRLDKLESELRTVIDSAKRQLDTAAEKAPDKPRPARGGTSSRRGSVISSAARATPCAAGTRVSTTSSATGLTAPVCTWRGWWTAPPTPSSTPRSSPKPSSTGTNGSETPPARPGSSPPNSSWPSPAAAPAPCGGAPPRPRTPRSV